MVVLSPPPSQEAVKTPQALLDAVERRGVREPQIPLGVAAESNPRRDGDVAALEELEGEPTRIAVETSAIGQHVEGSRRLVLDPEAHRAQAGHHRAAALVEDRSESAAVIARLSERRHPGPLDELVGRDEEVTEQLLERADVIGGRNEIAEPPAGHRVRLREAVEDECAIRELEDRPVTSLIREPVVDLVGDDHWPTIRAERRDGAEAVRSEHGSGGVAWRVDHDRFGTRPEAPGHRLRSQLKSVLP